MIRNISSGVNIVEYFYRPSCSSPIPPAASEILCMTFFTQSFSDFYLFTGLAHFVNSNKCIQVDIDYWDNCFLPTLLCYRFPIPFLLQPADIRVFSSTILRQTWWLLGSLYFRFTSLFMTMDVCSLLYYDFLNKFTSCFRIFILLQY